MCIRDRCFPYYHYWLCATLVVNKDEYIITNKWVCLTSGRAPWSWRRTSAQTLTCCSTRHVNTWKTSTPSTRSHFRCAPESPTAAARCRRRRRSRTRDFRRDFATRPSPTSSREICTATVASRTRLRKDLAHLSDFFDCFFQLLLCYFWMVCEPKAVSNKRWS